MDSDSVERKKAMVSISKPTQRVARRACLLYTSILIWMQTPENVLDLATLYLRIGFLGMTATMVYNFGAALLLSLIHI